MPDYTSQMDDLLTQKDFHDQQELIDRERQKEEAAQQEVAKAQGQAGKVAGWTSLADIPSRMIGASTPDRYQQLLAQYSAAPNAQLASAKTGLEGAQDKYKNMLEAYKATKQPIIDPLDQQLKKAKLLSLTTPKVDTKAVERISANLGNDLDPNKARTGNFGKAAAMKMSAERIEGLLNQFPNGDVPTAQTVELATAIASLVNGGSAPQSQKQIDEIVPSSIAGDGNKIASWFLNKPRGLQQQQFIKLMGETAAREKAIAEGQIQSIQASRLPKYNQFRKEHPGEYANILAGYGLDANDIDEKGQLKKKSSFNIATSPIVKQDYSQLSDAELDALYAKKIGSKVGIK